MVLFLTDTVWFANYSLFHIPYVCILKPHTQTHGKTLAKSMS